MDLEQIRRKLACEDECHNTSESTKGPASEVSTAARHIAIPATAPCNSPSWRACAVPIAIEIVPRARHTEWRSDAWDQAGALLKILGVFAVLLGVAVMIRPSRNPMADSIVATHSLSSRGSGLQLEPPRLVGLSLVDPIHRIHPSPAGVLNPAVPLQASIEQVLGKRGAGGTDHGPGFSSMIH